MLQLFPSSFIEDRLGIIDSIFAMFLDKFNRSVFKFRNKVQNAYTSKWDISFF